MLKVLFPWKQNNTKKVLFAMEQVVNEAEPSAEELPPEDLPLLPCHVCNRTFLPKPLKKHIPICEQALRRKRKPFDSLKQRVEGTDMAPFYQKSYLKRSSPEMSSLAQAGDVYGNNKVSKWREKHFELQKTIKNAKGSNTRSEMSTHPPSSNSVTPNRKTGHLNVGQTSSNERCPVCDRSFGPKAFDRHVEFCKEQRNRVQVHKSPAVVQQAKERLEARINYRVPPLRQSKRSLVRDKYLPASQTSVLLRSNSTVQAKSTTSISSSVTNMAPNRRQVNNERSVERNNNKKEREATNKTRLDRTIGDCGDTKESLKNETSSTKSFQTRRTIPAKKINKTEVNDGLQGITVSSLSVEKDKKLVTWKDTVKVQPKVTPAISLTTTPTNTKRKIITGTIQGESATLRSVEKTPSLGKVVRSKLLMEKLNMFVSKKKSPQIDEDLTRLFENPEEKRGNNKSSVKDKKVLTGVEFEKEKKEAKNKSIEKIMDFPDLCHISEEGEMEEESPKVCQRRITFDYDGDQNPLNVTRVIEKNQLVEEDLAPEPPNKNNASEEHSIADISDMEETTITIHKEDQKDYSDDESKTEEGSSSLCLRLPLEGLESKVKLRNNDLDPDQKLKKNIKSFYEIIKAGKCKMPSKREQLSLLESSKEIKFLEDELLLASSGSSFFGKKELDDEQSKDFGELLPSISTNDLKKEFDTTLEEPIESIEKNTEAKLTTLSASTKDITFRVASRQSRSWKTRKKLQKYRMCIKCLVGNVQNQKKVASNIRHFDERKVEVLEIFSSDDEWVFDSPEILGTFENIRKTSEDILKRKSKSANYLSSCKKNENYTAQMSLSLPNIRQNGNVDDAGSDSCDSRGENSFDNMVPRKRRKISPSYMNSGDDEKEIQKILSQNISKISTNYMDSGDDENELEKNLRQNISYMDSEEDEKQVEKNLRQISKISTSYINSVDDGNDFEKILRQNISYKNSEEDENEVEKNLRQISRISKSYINSVDDENDVEKILKQNISYKDSEEDENGVEKTLRQISKISTSYTDSGEYGNDAEKILRQNISYVDSEEDENEVEKNLRQISKISTNYKNSVDDENDTEKILRQNIIHKYSEEDEKHLRQISKISTNYIDSGDDKNDVENILRQNINNIDSEEEEENEVQDHLRQKEIIKISKTYMDSGDDESQIEKSLRQNISKIRRRKVGQTPPLILKYENTGLVGGKISSTDVLYRNNVFAKYRTPEISEAESLVDCGLDDDGILEYGDQILEDWDAGEEELFRQLERKKHLAQFKSPTRSLSTPNVAREENNNNKECKDEEPIVVESSETLKNSSACTIVNMPFDEDDSEEIDVVSSIQMLPKADKRSPEPEKLEEIVLSTKKTEPNLKKSSGCTIVNMPFDEDESEEIDVVSSMPLLPEVNKSPPESEKLEENVFSPRKTEPNLVTLIHDEIPCRLPRIIPRNKQKSPLRSAKRLCDDDFKLPIIGNLNHGYEADMLSDKLVQVPSGRAKASMSFCQQTSVMLVDNSSSFNRGDFQEDHFQELSPESQKNRSNRRLGTSNLVGLEIRKALQEEVRNVSPKEEVFNVNSTPTAEELYPDNAIMYEEFKKYEEMYRREKEERSSSSKKQKKITDFGINIDDSCKIYADSAYESLNRKQQSTEQDSSDQLKEFGLSTQSAATTPGERLPKFCHECGNKYPVPSAKFCVECGVRRLVL